MERDVKITFSRSDLACERRQQPSAGGDIFRQIRTVGGFTVTETVTEGGDGCPRGRYVTADIGRIWLAGDDRTAECAEVLAGELGGFISAVTDKPQKELCILVAGLGNRFITADALGPLTVDRLTVTRHMMGCGGIFDSMGCARLCAVMPGVLGQTGIEAVAVIRGAAEAAKPDAVIAVDALAARSVARLATTVQISDTGLCPGSGIGNRRVAINSETVGCPVISVGVPTVVDSATLVWDALEQAGVESGDVSPALREVLENSRGFFVSPGESDVIVREVAGLVASSIGLAVGI